MKHFVLITLLLGMINETVVFAQTKIKDGTVSGTGSFPNANAIAEFESSKRAVLFPRIALTELNAAAPLSAFVEGMILYNTATAGTAPNNVTPGYYYCDGATWVRIKDAKVEGWNDDAANAQIKLAYQSNGATARGLGTEFVIKDNGNVGIGTNNISDPAFKLFVETGIRTRKVKVDQEAWADFVFNNDYKLRPLREVERFIAVNKHLPDVPSAAEVKKEGLNLGENQALLLKKIEELTLYIIGQQKQIDEIKNMLQQHVPCIPIPK